MVGTQDIQGIAQESIRERYVYKNFDVKEDLLHQFNINETTEESISKIIQDVC